jgi:cobaltochelatase CobN
LGSQVDLHRLHRRIERKRPPTPFPLANVCSHENPWGLEEIGRRLLEAHERGLWDATPDVLEGLRAAYLEMEGWIEDRMGDAGGDVQGGAVRVVTVGDVKALRGAREKE